MPNPDVFLSYCHADKARIEPLVQRIRDAGLAVWWDGDLGIGSAFRDVISKMLAAASAVVVIWSRASLESDFVKDEADQAKKSGRLLGTRIDDVDPPLGHRQHQYADLSRWRGRDDEQLSKLLDAIQRLVEQGVVPQEDVGWSLSEFADHSREASSRLGGVTVDFETAVGLFKAAPAALGGLETAVNEVYRTYDAVRKAIDAFTKPPNPETPVAAYYKEIARGRLQVLVQSRRGHCTAISMAHFGDGGIRQALLEVHTDEASRESITRLDQVFAYLSTADGDVFESMGWITRGLAVEAAAIANMLVAGLEEAARERIRTAAQQLQPLEAELSLRLSELLRVAGELGVRISSS